MSDRIIRHKQDGHTSNEDQLIRLLTPNLPIHPAPTTRSINPHFQVLLTCAHEKSRIFRCALRAWSSVSGGQSSRLASVHSMSITLLAIMPSLSSSARRRMNSSSSSRCFFIAPTQLRCRRGGAGRGGAVRGWGRKQT